MNYSEKIKRLTDLNVKNKDGWTALMLASRYAKDESFEKTIEMLIEAKADLNLQDNDGAFYMSFILLYFIMISHKMIFYFYNSVIIK
jgi:ankyrin repeat protein